MESPSLSNRRRQQLMIDPTLRKQVRQLAVDNEVTISDVVNNLIDFAIAHRREGEPISPHYAN